ncbi:ankyrin 2 [Elysia marginata]|uniref:Ankyrin 2 n=1 Tax=Elysia marginata TaxID=1093978 RepID=A0AAV4GPH8_9GAST|nr:ankyrin 2 [Elysia marginata]
METRRMSKRKTTSDHHEGKVKTKKAFTSDDTKLIEAINSGDNLVVESILGSKGPKVSSETLESALLKAVEGGKRRIVQMLLNYGSSMDGANTVGATALLAAVEHGHLDIVKVLVEKGAFVDSKNADGRTALMLAVEKRCCFELVEYLLKKQRIDLNAQDNAGKTVLMLAVEQCDFKTVQRLLTFYNCKELIRDKNGHTALSLAKRNGFLDLLNLLRKSISEEKSPISLAVESDSLDLVKKLLEVCPSCVKENYGEDSILLTAMHGSDTEWDETIHCSFEMMELLLQVGSIPLQEQTWCCDYTALMLAARAGSEGAVEKLVKYGASLDYSRHNGQNALTMAAYQGHAKVVEMLIKAGANLKVRDKRGENVLSFAVMSRNRECITAVLNHWGCLKRVDIENLEDVKMLDVLEQVKGRWKKLLKEPHLYQILFKAIQTRSHSFTAALVDYGARLNAWCDYSCPLFLALDDAEMLRLLLDKGANVNIKKISDSKTALMIAASNGNVEAVRILIKYKADMYAESDGHTALTIASLGNKAEVVSALLDEGVDVNHVTQTKQIALSCATKANHMALKEMLIKYGAK